MTLLLIGKCVGRMLMMMLLLLVLLLLMAARKLRDAAVQRTCAERDEWLRRHTLFRVDDYVVIVCTGCGWAVEEGG